MGSMDATTSAAGPTIRWGVLGTGGIASAFVTDLAGAPGCEVVAVGSRTATSAQAFGERHAVPCRYGSREELLADPAVDVVYVATPHPEHGDGALAAIRAGKHVLVEKPFTMDGDEARAVVRAAREAGVFCMEAMWTRFLPHTLRIRELVAQGAVGTVRTVSADHGQWFAPDPEHRLYSPALGGGALLDLGVYPVSWASMLLWSPGDPLPVVSATSDPAFTGVDGQTSAVLRYGAAQAVVTCTLWAATPRRAFVAGDEGCIDVEPSFYTPTSFTLQRRDGHRERFDTPTSEQGPAGKGLRFEALEVARCLRAGLTESPGMPLDETIAVMDTLDAIRAVAAG